MSIYEFGPFALDSQRLLLFEGGEPVALGPKVVETLLALVEHPGDVLTKRALLERVWPEGYVDEANLAQNIYVLRKTLRARWEAPAIETIPRRGYRFIADVRCRDEQPPAQPAAVAVPAAAPVQSPARPYRLRWQVALAVGLVLALLSGLALAIARPRPNDGTLSVEGRRLYEIGRYYWNLRTPDGTAKSMQYFAHVIDTDPRNARGYAALASVNAIMGDYQYGSLPPKYYFARAQAYAHKALAIDPNCGEAYAVLGMISSEHAGSANQMTEAVSDLRRAIQIDPTSGPAHEWYGIALLELGRVHESYAELQKAADLDPLSVATMLWLGNAARLERRYGDAIAYARETLDLSPQRHEAYETLGLAYEALGDHARAIAAFHRLATDGCPYCRWQAAALLAEVDARMNRMSDARAELAIAQTHARDVAPEDLAIALAAVGERSSALSILRRTSGEYLRAEIANDPRFAVLRDDRQNQQFHNSPA